MSNKNAFLSFAQYVYSQLNGLDINGDSLIVSVDSDLLDAPYLRVEYLGESSNSGAVVHLAQLRLVLKKSPTEPLISTFTRVLQEIKTKLEHKGVLTKYDYDSGSPYKEVGGYVVELGKTSPELSTDGIRSQRVVTVNIISVND